MPSVEELLLRLRTEGFDEADAKLSAIQRRLRDLNRERAEAKVSVDDTGARARLAELSRTRHARINVDTDTSSVSAAFGRIKQDLSDMGQGAASWQRLVVGALPALVPLAGTLAQAAAGAGALGVAAGGAGAAFGVLGLAVKQSLAGAQTQQQAVTRAQQAVTRAEQAYQVTLQTGTRRQQQAAAQRVSSAEAQLAATKRVANAESGAATQVIGAWNSVKSTFASVMSAGVRETEQGMASILRAVRSDLPLLREPFRVLGGAVRDALTNPQVQAGLRQFVATFGQVVTASAPLAGPILRALIDIGQILANLARAAMPSLVQHAQRFVDWLDRMVGLTGDQDHMRAVIDRMVHSFDAVWHVVQQVVQALLPLFTGPVATGMLSLIGMVARLTGGLIDLLNHLGPVGQALGAGLGILLIIGRFRALFNLVRDTAGLLGGLSRIRIGGGGGDGGPSGWFGRLRDRIKGVKTAAEEEGRSSETAAGQNEKYAQSKRGVAEAAGAAAPAVAAVEGAVGAEGTAVTAAARATAQGGLVNRLLSGLRRVGLTGAAGAVAGGGAAALSGGSPLSIAAGALGGGAGFARGLSVPVATAAGSSVALITAAIAHWRGPITAAVHNAFSGAPGAARAALLPVSGAASAAMSASARAITASGPRVRSAASGVWANLARTVTPVAAQTRAALTGVMRQGQNAIRAALPAVRNASQAVWRGLALGAQSAVAPTRAAVNQAMRGGQNAVRSFAGPVRSTANSVWRGIATAAQATVASTRAAVNQAMRGGQNAVRAAAAGVAGNARATWRAIPDAARAIGGTLNAAVRVLMGQGRQAVSSAAPPVHSASSSTWSHIHSAAAAQRGPVASTLAGIMSGGVTQIRGHGPGIENAARGTWGGIKSALDWLRPILQRTLGNDLNEVPQVIRQHAPNVRSASQDTANQVVIPMHDIMPRVYDAGGQLVDQYAAGINAHSGVAEQAFQSVLDEMMMMAHGSEPRNPASPVRNMARRGRLMMEAFAAGITAGPVQQAFARAITLPNASLGHVPMPNVAGASAAATVAGRAVTFNLNFDASVHPADPAVQRRIARTVSSALRTNLSQHPPVRA